MMLDDEERRRSFLAGATPGPKMSAADPGATEDDVVVVSDNDDGLAGTGGSPDARRHIDFANEDDQQQPQTYSDSAGAAAQSPPPLAYDSLSHMVHEQQSNIQFLVGMQAQTQTSLQAMQDESRSASMILQQSIAQSTLIHSQMAEQLNLVHSAVAINSNTVSAMDARIGEIEKRLDKSEKQEQQASPPRQASAPARARDARGALDGHDRSPSEPSPDRVEKVRRRARTVEARVPRPPQDGVVAERIWIKGFSEEMTSTAMESHYRSLKAQVVDQKIWHPARVSARNGDNCYSITFRDAESAEIAFHELKDLQNADMLMFNCDKPMLLRVHQDKKREHRQVGGLTAEAIQGVKKLYERSGMPLPAGFGANARSVHVRAPNGYSVINLFALTKDESAPTTMSVRPEGVTRLGLDRKGCDEIAKRFNQQTAARSL